MCACTCAICLVCQEAGAARPGPGKGPLRGDPEVCHVPTCSRLLSTAASGQQTVPQVTRLVNTQGTHDGYCLVVLD
jgi:hypothetical protein